jgi:hypothetical protein
MADFFKGLAGGFGTGLQFGQAMRERNMREELAQAYAKPETFQGYTAEQGQQLEAMANAINPETGRPYYNVQAGQGGNYTVTPDFTESQIPRTGVDTGSQYGVAPVDLQATGLGRAGVVSQPIPFNQQQVQEYGGRRVAGQFDPEQLRGLQMREAARVLGSYGDPARAAQLEAEATRMEREAEERPLRLRNLEQQVKTGELTISEKERLAEEQTNIGKAREELRELRAKGPLTAAAIADVSGRYKLDPTKFLQAEDAVNTLEIKDLKRNLSTAALKGEAGLNQFLADKFDPDKTDNIKPMITKAKDGSFVVSYGDRVLEEYGAHKNMMSLVGGVINIIDQNPFDTLKTLSTLETQAQARKASEAATNLSNIRTKGLQSDDATQARLKDIRDQFTALTPEQKLGPEGRALEREYNMVTAGPGKQVSTGAAPRPEVTAAAVVEYAKGLVGKPSGVMKDGKPVKYTAETAAAAARRALSAQDGAAADPADALIEAMRKNAPAQQQATPAGQGLINLSNTMLPPAAPVRAAPTTSQERLRGLYLGQ